MADQIQRAAVSIPSNIAEGWGKSGSGYYLNAISHARGSLRELETLLLIAHRVGYIKRETFLALAERTDEVARMIKTADRGAAYLEATRLAGFSASEAQRFFGPPPKLSQAVERDYLTPWPAGTAEKRFLERFNALVRP